MLSPAPRDEISRCLAGEKLYGEDLSPPELEAWLASEKEGYAELGASDRSRYAYKYHALNVYHHYRHLPDARFPRALGLGSAYGDELAPIAERLDHITILDPSDAFAGSTTLFGRPCDWVKPQTSGDLPFASGTFDLITCFGVLHHIPNVTHAIVECHRVLAPGGYFLLREPIVSMGDWRRERPGLTKNERGIPRPIFERVIREAGFVVVSKSLCNFRPIAMLSARAGVPAFNHSGLVRADALFSWLSGWNYTYHRTRTAQKLAPASMAFVLRK